MRVRKRRFRILSMLLILILLFLAARWIIRKAYPLEHENYITSYSREYKLDPYLVMAIIKTESNYKLDAKSNKNAHGLMQITEDTGQWIAGKMNIDNFNKDMLYEPQSNIKMGCWYLDNLRGEFGNNVDLILAAYNAGRGNVENWLKNKNYSKNGRDLDYIPFKETDKYIKKVRTNYNIYKFIYGNELTN